MKNKDVVSYYVAGSEKGKTTNLRIEGDKLINYNTCLAQRHVDEEGMVSYVVNATKYSQSTTTIQNMILNTIPSDMINKTVVDVPMGASSLV